MFYTQITSNLNLWPPPLHPRGAGAGGGFKSLLHQRCRRPCSPHQTRFSSLWPPHSPHLCVFVVLCKSSKTGAVQQLLYGNCWHAGAHRRVIPGLMSSASGSCHSSPALTGRKAARPRGSRRPATTQETPPAHYVHHKAAASLSGCFAGVFSFVWTRHFPLPWTRPRARDAVQPGAPVLLKEDV